MAQKRPIKEIAQEILNDWVPPNDYAGPYLEAMLRIDRIEDMYFEDTAESVVAYFLSNAGTWRGEKAREIKKELNAML